MIISNIFSMLALIISKLFFPVNKSAECRRRTIHGTWNDTQVVPYGWDNVASRIVFSFFKIFKLNSGFICNIMTLYILQNGEHV